MTSGKDPMLAYLDQNVLSRLRLGEGARHDLLLILKYLTENNVIFVYSMIHVEECRASDQPEAFVQVIEELSAYLIENVNFVDQKIHLALGRARDLFLAENDITDQAQRRMEDLLKIFHFAAGWLGDVEVSELKEEISIEMESFWTSLEKEMDWSILGVEVEARALEALREAKHELSELIQNLPVQQLRIDFEKALSVLNARLPQNFAQLDEISTDDVVAHILSCFEDSEKEEIQTQFPQGFWSDLGRRQDGQLAGFAFMIFLCGLVRDRRVRTKDRKRREKHFLGQFRDCIHIENAAFCSIFVTFDEGAARLARAVYSYSGVETKVLHLAVRES